VRTGDGTQGNGQYALNASGTAKLDDVSNLGLSGYTDRSTRPFTYRFTPESQIESPAEMIAVGDIEPGSPAPLFWSADHFDPVSTNRSYWPGKLHTGRANMLFCDGHVRCAPQTDWLAANEAARSQWNSDGKPHPETWLRP
jgi:prepilin-type processing-associated H-X9-DG protein